MGPWTANAPFRSTTATTKIKYLLLQATMIMQVQFEYKKKVSEFLGNNL